MALTGVTATAGSEQATVNFTAPAGATSVKVQQSTDGTTWTDSTTAALTAASTSATVTGLTNGTEYQFRVVVVGGLYEGTSNVVTATPAPAAPTGVVGTVSNPTPYAAATTAAKATITGNDIVYTAVADGIALNGKTITVVQGGTTNTTAEPSVLTVDGTGNFTFTIGDDSSDVSLVTDKDSLLAQITAAISAYDLANASAPAGITAAFDTGVTGTDTATVDLTATPLAGGNVTAAATPAQFAFEVTTTLATTDTLNIGSETYTNVTNAASIIAAINANGTSAYTATATGEVITLTQKVAATGAAPTVTVTN